MTPKFGNQKFDQAVPFAFDSTETGQDTMRDVKEASIVEKMIVGNILSTVVNEYADYQDLFFPEEASETISEKTSLKSEQPAYCMQKTVKRRDLVVNDPGSVRSINRKQRKIVSSIAQIETSCRVKFFQKLAS